MTSNIVARRYARALFTLGKRTSLQELEKNAAALESIRAAVAASPDLAQVFRSPVFSVGDKAAIIKALAKKLKFGGTILNFCLLLADKKRLSSLEGIAEEYSALLDAEKGVMRGQLLTAVPLQDEHKQALVAKLEKQAKRTLLLNFGVSPEILGGVVLKVGDQVMDASLRAQLSILKDTIKRGE